MKQIAMYKPYETGPVHIKVFSVSFSYILIILVDIHIDVISVSASYMLFFAVLFKRLKFIFSL